MKYKFEVTIEDGCDEFWDENPTPKDLIQCLERDLKDFGWKPHVAFLLSEDNEGQLGMKLDEN